MARPDRPGVRSPLPARVAGGLAAVVAVGYGLAVLLGAPPRHDEALQASAFLLVAALAWVRAVGAGRRLEDFVLAAGLTCSALGWGYWSVWLAPMIDPPYPTPADLLWVALFPALLVALGWQAVARGSAWQAVMLDTLVVGAGLTAAVGGLVVPRFVADGAALTTMRVNSIYVGAHAAHALLVLTVLGMRRFRDGGLLWLRLAGAVLYTATNAVFLFQVAGTGRVPLGTLLNVGWLVAFTLTTCSIGAARPVRDGAPPWRPTVLVLPVLGTTLALLTLLGDAGSLPWARGVAGVAMLLALARMGLALVQADRLRGSHHLAVTDDLTGLANRRGFYDALRRLLATGTPTAVVLIDLNRFKDVNDTLGHRVGDLLLAQVAVRLRHAVLDQGGRHVARVGGDEFAVLLHGSGTEDDERAARRVTEALSTRYDVDGVTVRMSAAAGLVHVPLHGDDLDELLRRADVAMYAAKATHESLVVYRTDLDTRSRDDLARLESLRSALLEDGLVLHYQPKVDLRTGTVVGVEALARLRVQGTVLPPAAFLDALGQGGMLRTLTALVLDRAVGQAAAWAADGLQLSVAVNVPADSWIDADLERQVTAVLSRHGLPGRLLFLEVTEEALLADKAAARAAIEAVRALGVRVSIDDYGTGYSSLAYLRDLPVDEIKLDRSFVRGMADDPRALTIVESSAALAHGLDLVVVAEGVEDEADRRAALRAGCDLGQGYLFARPVAADELAAVVRAWPSLPRP